MSTGRMEDGTTLPRDGNSHPIQTVDSFAVGDATDTPITSPIATGTTEIALIAPDKALNLVIHPLTQDVRLLYATGGSTYLTLAAGGYYNVAIKADVTTYIGRPNSTVVEFIYELAG